MISSTQLLLLAPELALAITALGLLPVAAMTGERSHAIIQHGSVAGLLLALAALCALPNFTTATVIAPWFLMSTPILAAKAIALAASFAVMLLMVGQSPYARSHIPAEAHLLMLFATLGSCLLLSANHLLMVYLGIELQSLSLYVLIAMYRDQEKSTEAGLKYFVLGALASGIMLFGMSLIYGFTGSMTFDGIEAAMQAGMDGAPIGLVIGLLMVVVSLCFKLAAAPMHMWAPDAYEGAPTITTTFLATIPKIAAMGILLRLLLIGGIAWAPSWQWLLIAFSGASMLIGSLGAYKQFNIKRLLAYSAIAHAGYMLMAVAAMDKICPSVWLYLIVYVAGSLGIFACVMMMWRQQKPAELLSDFAGLSTTQPGLAFILTLLLLSMAGIPPLAGFFSKYLVFIAAYQAGLLPLVLLGILASVIATFYYLKIIKMMYMDEVVMPLEHCRLPLPMMVAAVATLIQVIFIFMPNYWLDIATVVGQGR
jgi:NADH-quinone oxidoreductase subunit N